jgi:predicted nucleotidyltransferase
MTPSSPAEALFGAYRRKTLAFLLLHPESSFYVREIGRITGIPAGSLHRELKRLATAGIITRKRVGNQVRYQANRDSPVFAELAGFFRKTTGLADVLQDALAGLGRSIELALVFGSMAQGIERFSSDVDVLVVGQASFVQLVQALASTSTELGREVNPVVMSKEVLRDKHLSGDRFVNRIISEPKLFIIGSEHDLGELAGYRPAQEA